MFTLNNSCDGKYESVDIRFTKACDNDCSFCIEKKGLPSLGKTNVDKLIESTLSTNIKNVLIIGGEPFLFIPELLKFIVGIRHNVDKIYVTTSLPKTIDLANKDVLEIFNLVDGVNVSVQALDWEENNRILLAKSNHNRHGTLRDILKDYSDKVRVNLNLIRGGIDSKDKLLGILDFLRSIGAKHIKLNELQDSTESYISYEQMMEIKLASPYSGGCQNYLDDYKGMKILLKRSCFMVQPRLDATFKDFLKFSYKSLIHKSNNKFNVIYENGRIENNWLVAPVKENLIQIRLSK